MPIRHMAYGPVFAIAAVVLIANPAVACTKETTSHGNNGDKVTICHATNSQTNPYVKIEVSTSAVDEGHNKERNGHGDHGGSVWHEGIAAHSWGDIIPAFESAKGAHYPGKNLSTEGKAILDAGCTLKVTPVEQSTKPTTPPKHEGKPDKPNKDKDCHDKTDTKPTKPTDPGRGSTTAPAKPAETSVPVAGAQLTAVITPAAAKPATMPRELPHTGIVAYSVWLITMGLGAITYLVTRSVQRFAKQRASR